MTRIIAAIDNSAAARGVLATASVVATMLDATAEAVHVRENGESTAEAAASRADVPLRNIISLSGVGPGLIGVAREPDVVAVVLGTRRTPAGARPAGHIALEVITAVEKPAILVPPDAESTALKRVLVPVTGEPSSSAAMRTTLRFVDVSSIEIVVLHVYDEARIPAFTDQPGYETEAWAREFIARYVPAPPESVRLELRVGVPGEQVLRVCRDSAADMVALGWSQDLSRGHGAIVGAVLERCSVPVLLLPLVREPAVSLVGESVTSNR